MAVQSPAEIADTSRDHPVTEIAAPKMDPALKAKWVEALRSGKYTQGTGYLEMDGAMCCLGVLAKVQGEDVALWRTEKKQSSRLPEELRAGLTIGGMSVLAHHNDGTAGYSRMNFPEIADFIESNL